jgi:hypothetical protein
LNVEVCVESWEARIMFDVKEMQPRYIGGGMLIDGLLQLLDERRACLDTLVINSDTFIGILQTDSVPNYIPVARQVKLVNEALVTKKSLMRVKEGGQLTCTSVSLATNVSTAADIQAAIAQWGSAKDELFDWEEYEYCRWPHEDCMYETQGGDSDDDEEYEEYWFEVGDER